MRTAGICLLSAVLAFFVGKLSFHSRQERGKVPSPETPTGGDLRQVAPLSAQDNERRASARERLIAALQGNDALAAAPRAQAWIDAATLADYQDLIADGTELDLPRFEGFDEEFRRLFYDALVRRWFELDSDAALAGLVKIRSLMGDYSASEWIEGAARCRPEVILANFPLDHAGGGLASYASVAFRALACRSAAEARRYLDRAESEAGRRTAQAEIIRGVAQSDPVAAVTMASGRKDVLLYDFALACAERIGAGAVREVIAAIPREVVASSLPRLMLQYPSIAGEISGHASVDASDLDDGTRSAADAMTPEQRQRTLADYDSAPPAFRDTMAAAVVSAWARSEPAQAGEWALAHANAADPNASANLAAREVMQRWMKTDPDAALGWWRALPDSALRDALGISATAFFAEQGRVAEAIELFRPGNLNRDDSHATTDLARIFAESDPAAAADWFATLPDGLESSPAAREIMTSWMSRDRGTARTWLDSASPGKHRDEAAGVYIESEAEKDPQEAAGLVLTVDDPQLRQQSALWVYWKMRENGAEAAERWLRGEPGLDENWRARILRTGRGRYTYFNPPDRWD